MQLKLEVDFAKARTAELLVVGVRPGTAPSPALARLDQASGGQVARELEHRGFDGRRGMVLLPTYGYLGARDVLLFGLGTEPAPHSFRLLGEAALQTARNIRAASFAIVCEGLSAPQTCALAEGLALSAYRFASYKSQTDARAEPEAMVVVEGGEPEYARALAEGLALGQATNFARDLINTPAREATPEFLAEQAATLARVDGLECRIHDRRGIEELAMGALLGVAQASPREPRFIELTYRPQAAGTAPRPDLDNHVALVGKGITFDSGGLNLKTAAGMEEQKRDMTGAAIMLGVMSQLAYFKPPVAVRAYLPCTENMIGSGAIKPGDVLRTRLGKTVEVLNTDAEGRLVLADAIAYACEFKPAHLIDAGTLTAAVRGALGTRVGAVLGNDQRLIEQLREAGAGAGEALWQLPLVAEYADELQSAVADLRNIGTSGNAGTIICALFLSQFVSCPSWAHLDLSGVSFTNRALPLTPPGAVGFGVRTLLRYLMASD